MCWVTRTKTKAAYGQSIQYSLSTLISFVETLPATTISWSSPSATTSRPRSSAAQDASRDVPITIIAHDPEVMNRIASWGWQPGMLPNPARSRLAHGRVSRPLPDRRYCGSAPYPVSGELAGRGWSSARDELPTADVVLLRHGDTRLTPERRFSGVGSGDPGLSADRPGPGAAGRRLGPAAGERLHRSPDLADDPVPGDRCRSSPPRWVSRSASTRTCGRWTSACGKR